MDYAAFSTVSGFEYWTLNGKRLFDLPFVVEVASDDEET